MKSLYCLEFPRRSSKTWRRRDWRLPATIGLIVVTVFAGMAWLNFR
jgi:hypothetical protein